jgi:hypothetical protein
LPVRERQTYFLAAGFGAIALVLGITALITWNIAKGLANPDRSKGDAEITAIDLPNDWSRGRIDYHANGPNWAGPTEWDVTFTSSDSQSASLLVFRAALAKAGWHPCNVYSPSTPCWVKTSYTMNVDISTRTDCSTGSCTEFDAAITAVRTEG